MTLGAEGYIGYAPETTEGTSVAPTKFIPVRTFEFEDSDDDIILDQVRQSRDRSVALPAPYSVSGSMELDFIPTDILPLLEAAFGAVAVTSAYGASTSGYQHVMAAGNSEPTFTFEESKGSSVVIMRRIGVRVNTLEMKAAFGEVCTLNMGLEGLTRNKEASASTPSYTEVNPLHFDGVSVKLGGTASADFKDFTFMVGNNNERIGTLQTTRAYKRQTYGMRDVTLSATLDFEDDTEFDRFFAGTYFDVELHFRGDAFEGAFRHYAKVVIPKVKWKKIGAPVSADYIEQSVEATILKAAGSAICTLTVINNETASEAGLA